MSSAGIVQLQFGGGVQTCPSDGLLGKLSGQVTATIPAPHHSYSSTPLPCFRHPATHSRHRHTPPTAGQHHPPRSHPLRSE